MELLAAALLFALLALGFLARGLPAGRAPVCVDALYRVEQNVPFASVRPEGFEPHNPYLSDQALVFYPWLKFMSEAVRSGELPLWSPHSGGGQPFIGNLSSAFFFPTTWLSFLPEEILTTARGMLFGALIRLWMAGFFGFLFLRRIGNSRPGSLLGGVGLMLFGYQTVWLFYSLSNVACLIPLCLYLTQRFVERPSAKRGVLLAVAMALQFLGGHAETSLALAIAVAAWYVASVRWSGRPLPGMAARFALIGLLSLALCSFQLLPFVEYLLPSQGRHERLIALPATFEAVSPFSAPGAALCLGALLLCVLGWRTLSRDRRGLATVWGGALAGVFVAVAIALLSQTGLRPHLLLAIEPDLFGNPLQVAGYRGPEAYTDMNGGYVGALALVLSLLYLLCSRRGCEVARSFGFLLILAWVLPGHVEPFYSLLKAVPPFDLAANTRMLPLAGLAVSVLAAGALTAIGKGEGPRYARALARLGICGGVLALCAGASFLSEMADSPDPWKTAAPEQGIVLASPQHGQVFKPEAGVGVAGRIGIPMVVTIPPGFEAVRVRAGEGLAALSLLDAGLKENGGRVDLFWNADRLEAGRYDLRVEAILPPEDPSRPSPLEQRLVAGPNIEVVIDRDPRPTAGGLLRIGGAVLLLLVLTILGGRRIWVLCLAPVAVAAELFLFGFDYNVYVPEKIVYPPTEVTDFLRNERERWFAEERGPFRVLGENVILQPNMHYAYGFETPRSYDQLEVRQFNIFRTFVFGNVGFMSYSHRTVDFGNPRFSLLNVAFVVSAEDLDHLPAFRKVAHDGNARVYQNLAASPRATIVGNAVNLNDYEDRKAELFQLDPRAYAMLEESPPSPLGGTGTARMARYDLNAVDVLVNTDGPAMLLLTDNAFPGWNVTVNGQPERIYRSHFTFRAVAVPAGESVVEFRYRPWSFYGGLLLALAGLLIATIVVWRADS